MSKYVIDEQTLTDIADAVRTKSGSTAVIQVSDLDEAIMDIPSAGLHTTYVDVPVISNVLRREVREVPAALSQYKTIHEVWCWNNVSDRNNFGMGQQYTYVQGLDIDNSYFHFMMPSTATNITMGSGYLKGSPTLGLINQGNTSPNTSYTHLPNIEVDSNSGTYQSNKRLDTGYLFAHLYCKELPQDDPDGTKWLKKWTDAGWAIDYMADHMFYASMLREVPQWFLEKEYSSYTDTYSRSSIKVLYYPPTNGNKINIPNGTIARMCRRIIFLDDPNSETKYTGGNSVFYQPKSWGGTFRPEEKMIWNDATMEQYKDDPDAVSLTKQYSFYGHDACLETIRSLPKRPSSKLATATFYSDCGTKYDGGTDSITAAELTEAQMYGKTGTTAWSIAFQA